MLSSSTVRPCLAVGLVHGNLLEMAPGHPRFLHPRCSSPLHCPAFLSVKDLTLSHLIILQTSQSYREAGEHVVSISPPRITHLQISQDSTSTDSAPTFPRGPQIISASPYGGTTVRLNDVTRLQRCQAVKPFAVLCSDTVSHHRTVSTPGPNTFLIAVSMKRAQASAL